MGGFESKIGQQPQPPLRIAGFQVGIECQIGWRGLLTIDQPALDAATTALTTATANANAAFALATRNHDNPAVKTYIDGLLAKYYAYLGQP